MFNMQTWSDEFFSAAKNPMEQDISYVFLQMLMADEKPNFSIEKIKEEFLYKVIDSRAQYIGLKLSEAAKIFLLFKTKSPGTAVMYLYAIRSKTEVANMKTISELFEYGFLSSEDEEKMWDAQKGFNCDEKKDNCLDSYSF